MTYYGDKPSEIPPPPKPPELQWTPRSHDLEHTEVIVEFEGATIKFERVESPGYTTFEVLNKNFLPHPEGRFPRYWLKKHYHYRVPIPPLASTRYLEIETEAQTTGTITVIFNLIGNENRKKNKLYHHGWYGNQWRWKQIGQSNVGDTLIDGVIDSPCYCLFCIS